MAKKKNNTYIKLYRSTLENNLFNVKPFDDWRAFEYLILKARVEPCDLVLSTGEIIHLERGQHFESRKSLAEKFGWSVKKIRAWEDRLKRLKMGTAKGTGKGTLYTLENYGFYQGEGHGKGHSEGQPQGTSQGTRKKNDKECIKNARAREDETPRGAEERKVIPMPEEIKTKWKDFMEG